MQSAYHGGSDTSLFSEDTSVATDRSKVRMGGMSGTDENKNPVRKVRDSYGIILFDTPSFYSSSAVNLRMLCVQHRVSFTFRSVMYRLGKLMSSHLSDDEERSQDGIRYRYMCESSSLEYLPRGRYFYERVGEISRLVARLSAREYHILKDPYTFEVEVRIAYGNGREHLISRIMSGYRVSRSRILRPGFDPWAVEGRWSPPKGAPTTSYVEESPIEAAMREVREETGLTYSDYHLLQHSTGELDMINVTYDAVGYVHRITFFLALLSPDVSSAFTPCRKCIEDEQVTFLPQLPSPILHPSGNWGEIEGISFLEVGDLHLHLPLEYGTYLRDAIMRWFLLRGHTDSGASKGK